MRFGAESGSTCNPLSGVYAFFSCGYTDIRMSHSHRLFLTFCLLACGCTTGGDDSIPPTLDAISRIESLTPDPREAAANATKDAAERSAEPAEMESTEKVTESGVYRVEFITTEGKFLVEVNREWAPIGADRFYKLVKDKFFDDAAFFRVVKGFMVQFGLPADPSRNARWSRNLRDDPVVKGNKRGFLTFAQTGQPNSRTTQLFINYTDNAFLDAKGFAALGQVVEGMDVVDKLNGEYGETPSQSQGTIREQGNAFLSSRFPNLSYIQTARIVVDDLAATDSQ